MATYVDKCMFCLRCPDEFSIWVGDQSHKMMEVPIDDILMNGGGVDSVMSYVRMDQTPMSTIGEIVVRIRHIGHGGTHL